MGKVVPFNGNKELTAYFNGVLEEQGWQVTEASGRLRYLSKTFPDGTSYGFSVSDNVKTAMADIEKTYRGYIRNGLKQGIVGAFLAGGNLNEVAEDTGQVLSALRRLRNAFEPHDNAVPEWLKDMAATAMSLGMETLCSRTKDGYSLLCVIPYLDYAIEFEGTSQESMAVDIDFLVDTFSEQRHYLYTIQEKPESNDYEVIAKARLVKSVLEDYRCKIMQLVNVPEPS